MIVNSDQYVFNVCQNFHQVFSSCQLTDQAVSSIIFSDTSIPPADNLEPLTWPEPYFDLSWSGRLRSDIRSENQDDVTTLHDDVRHRWQVSPMLVNPKLILNEAPVVLKLAALF